ncbi:MAG: DUF2922 domain-containing protein [Tissierellia bacterium]|nr:DUF2922 domain-containing protein [Tissierellia bacterium]
MKTSRVLKLNFMEASGKVFGLRLNDPKEGLTSLEVDQAMTQILGAGVFYDQGDLVDRQGAELVTTTTETLFQAEA